MNPKPSLRFRLLGFRMVESAEDQFVIRFPFWCTAAIIDMACERFRRDAAIVGRNVRITRGDRLVRFERVA